MRVLQHAALVVEADLAHLGFRKTWSAAYNQARWEIKCAACGKNESLPYRGNISPDQILRKRGWVLGHNDPPLCSHKHLRALERTKAMEKEQTRKEETQVPSIGPDFKLMRRVYALLDDHYDTDTRRYRGHWTDALIAKEANASLKFVIDVRDTAYSKLAEDPAITQLRTDLEAVEDLIRQLRARFDQLAGYRKAAG